MKTTTIYKVCSAHDDSVALSLEEISEMVQEMKQNGDDFEDYDIEVLSSLSSNRLDNEGDYAIEYEIPEDWMPELQAMKATGRLTWWKSIIEFSESKGYLEDCDSSKFGSWGYKFVQDPSEED